MELFMKEFKKGQPILCPSLSTTLLYAYPCSGGLGMLAVDNRSQIQDQIHHRRRFNNVDTSQPNIPNT
jgi:hypothetical protein